MIKPKKFGHLHLVYHFTVPLSKQNFNDINVEGNKKKGDDLLYLCMCGENKIR